MQALIIGAAGMIGGKLAASLARDPEPGLEALTLVDVVEPAAPAGRDPGDDGRARPDRRRGGARRGRRAARA